MGATTGFGVLCRVVGARFGSYPPASWPNPSPKPRLITKKEPKIDNIMPKTSVDVIFFFIFGNIN